MNKLWMYILSLTSNLLYRYRTNLMYTLETSTFASGLLQRTCFMERHSVSRSRLGAVTQHGVVLFVLPQCRLLLLEGLLLLLRLGNLKDTERFAARIVVT